MSLDQFMADFGIEPAENITHATTGPTLTLESALGALDEFIDEFSGKTEPYFFYYVDGKPTVELRFQVEEHLYYLVGELGELILQDGVTTICHIIDKSPALVPWAAKMVVAKLLRLLPTVDVEVPDGEDHLGARVVKNLAPMSLEAFEKILQDAKTAPRDKLEEAGDVGHMAHTWLEFYIKSVIALGKAKEAGDEAAIAEHQQSIESKLANLPKDERASNCAKAALAWMNEHDVKWVETERKIYSKKHSYAGTLDGLALVSSCNNPLCCVEKFKDRFSVIDWKSSNYLYIEYLYQTAAYQHAISEEFGGK
jgi:hypothetical protein